MKLVVGLSVVSLIFALWCMLKAGSDADDEMGYDDVIE